MDRLTQKQRRRNMQRIKGKDTSIEKKLRKALWNCGIRYRKNYKKLPGKPDIVLTKFRIAIFCDGEFFHGKDWDELSVRIANGNNSEYWGTKILNNIHRDSENDKKLRAMEWNVIHFWGREIEKNVVECVEMIKELIFEIQIEKNELE